MLPDHFSFVIPGRLAGMARPPDGPELVDALIELGRRGVTAVVSLTERPPDRAALAQAGFAHLHEPIYDFQPPTTDQIDGVVSFVRSQWEAGRGVAIHCAAGIGRTGTMLACVLVAEGRTAADAIREIREARPGSIETRAQERSVREYETRLRRDG